MPQTTNAPLPPRARAASSHIIYTAPLARTMAGYKLISNTFILSGGIAAMALLYSSYISPLVSTRRATAAAPAAEHLSTEAAAAVAETAADLAAIEGPSPILGASAILIASLLPFVLQQSFVPRYVSCIALDLDLDAMPAAGGGKSGNMAALEAMSSLSPSTPLRLTYFTALGRQRSIGVRIADLSWTPASRFSWANLRNQVDGKVYSLERRNVTPAAARVLVLIDRASSA